MREPRWVPGPWTASKVDWRGKPVEHDMYIVGNVHECHDEDDDEITPHLVATSVAIVPGNATGVEITGATAALICAAPVLYAALDAAPVIRLNETIEQFADRYSLWYREMKVAALAKARGEVSPHVHTRDCYDDAGPGAGGVSLICGEVPDV